MRVLILTTADADTLSSELQSRSPLLHTDSASPTRLSQERALAEKVRERAFLHSASQATTQKAQIAQAPGALKKLYARALFLTTYPKSSESPRQVRFLPRSRTQRKYTGASTGPISRRKLVATICSPATGGPGSRFRGCLGLLGGAVGAGEERGLMYLLGFFGQLCPGRSGCVLKNQTARKCQCVARCSGHTSGGSKMDSPGRYINGLDSHLSCF